jgi:hypothetical protein
MHLASLHCNRTPGTQRRDGLGERVVQDPDIARIADEIEALAK